MNLPRSWVMFLNQHGFSTQHWSSIGSSSAPDEELMRWAKEHEHVVLTQDLDFGVMLALTGGRSPSVIQIRAGTLFPEDIGMRVLADCRD